MTYEDPRTLRYEKDGAVLHTRGFWRSAKDGSNVPYRRFQFTLEMDSDTNFNLSLYTCASDLWGWSTYPLNYYEHFGYDVEMLVTDSVGTQSFRITNNAGGCWITFPVQPGEGNVLVEIRARGNNATPSMWPPENPPEDPLPAFDLSVVGEAVLSGIAFDPYENRTTRMGYNEAGRVTLVRDGMGNSWVNVYDDMDGTLVSSLEPGQVDPTLYYYEDAYKNLTSVEDPLGGVSQLVYDLNGNVTSVTDADNRETSFTLDGRNRVVQVQDAAGNSSSVTYDAGGRVVQSEDAEGRITALAYKHGRIWKITDALEQVTTVTYQNSGLVSSVTDARGKVTEFTYNAGNELIEREFADGAVLSYARDALGRVTGVTSPNGNQSDVDLINLEGAKNLLYNPSGQESRPFDPNSFLEPDGDLAPRYWKTSTGAPRELDSDGQAYFPLNTTVENWEQKNIPASAGARYLAQFVARKEDNTSGTTKARLEFQYRLHKDIPYPVGHQSLSDTVEGEEYEPLSQDWEASGRSRLDIPGDTQSSLHRPVLARARAVLSTGSAPLGVRNLQLQRLSTCLEFDGENLREVCFPDGARQRTEYDRLGRAFLTRDPDGRTILREFDALDRVVHVVDSLGNELFFQYDDKLDMVLFRLRSQGVDQDTEFEWDALHRLKSVTYMDATTELFEYSAGGDLVGYEDNLTQERVFHYDELHRLDLITYPDTTTVALSYDKVGNLLSTVERDGKGWDYTYDALNRPVSQQYTGQEGLVSEYNEIGQRDALRLGTVYGEARFGVARYGGSETLWSVPPSGRDEVGRLLTVEDANSDATSMQYDVDGRCVQIDRSNSLSELMTYDIVGKLLSITVQGSENLLEMRYGYSLAGDRIAQQTDRDTFTYLTDAAGRLVEETHNRFCIDQPSVWKQGQWDLVELDEATRRLRLLPFGDSFAGSVMNLQRWTLESHQVDRALDNFLHYFDNLDDIPLDELDSVGMELRQNDGLSVTYPRALHNQTFWHRAAVDNSVGIEGKMGAPENEGYPESFTPHPWWINMRHREKLVGDFDIALDYENMRGIDERRFGLFFAVSPATLNPDVHPDVTWLSVQVQRESRYDHIEFTKASTAGTGHTGEWNPPPQGEIRLARTGSTFQAWYRAKGASTWFSMSTLSGPTEDLYLYLCFASDATPGNIQVSNLRRLSGHTMATQGTFLSGIYDAGRVVSWDSIRWTETKPSGCDVELEVCVADEFSEFEDFVSPPVFFGPTGGGAFTTPGGQALPAGKTGRYAMVRATLTGNGTSTPTLSDIQLTCNASSDLGSRVVRYRYDQAGNILGIVTADDSGVNKEVRDKESWAPEERINSLNQLMRQSTGHETWRFTYDDNGNLTQKTCGADTYTYVWNEDNRLIQVTKEVTLGGWGAARFHEGTFHQAQSTSTAWVVDYTYDSAGRMMSRDDNNGNVTNFQWDGWDVVREVTGESVTEYLIPQGMLLSFRRDGVTYHASCDALGSVRLVTDDEGEVVSRFEYSGYGALLEGSFDGVPGGMPFQWVGAAGVRVDAISGLHYMRQRWYDLTCQRFVSRDPIGLQGSLNLYSYCDGSPMDLIDSYGLDPVPWPYSKCGNLGPVDHFTAPEKSPLDPDGAFPMTVLTLIAIGELAVSAAPAAGYLMLQGGTALEAYGFSNAGLTLASGGTGLTFWGLGIGAPKMLPNAKNAKIPEGKIRNYALDPNHKVGGHKARVFKSALDIERSHSDWVRNQIQGKVMRCPMQYGKLDEHGQRFTVEINIVGPMGRVKPVITGWIIKPGERIPTLTTLMVK